MKVAVLEASAQADVLLMAAAVGDYRPADTFAQKLKKTEEDLTLQLTRTPDVLVAVTERRRETGYPRVTVGFAAETEGLLANARAKREAKRLELIVANDVTAAGAGFGAETNRVVLLDRDGSVEELPLMSKAAVAEAVLERATDLLLSKDRNHRSR
jgi:phosphopantothenoylcysteine decarboxylase/phosphopantothenate--cysteine ligase